MPRHTEPDLRKDWKISLPATLAGAVEFELLDPTTRKPRYAERSRLIGALLSGWLAARGRDVPADLPASDLYTPPPKPQVLEQSSEQPIEHPSPSIAPDSGPSPNVEPGRRDDGGAE